MDSQREEEKVMLSSQNKKSQFRFNCNEYVLIGTICAFLLALPASAQFSQSQYASLADQIDKEKNLRDVAWSFGNLAFAMRSTSDDVRSMSMMQSLKLVGLILSTRDLSIAEGTRACMWTSYQGTEFGGRPLMGGHIDPNTISDPRVRERYIKERADHELYLGRLDKEDDKIEAAAQGISFAATMINDSKDRGRLKKEALSIVNSFSGEAWIKEYVLRKLDFGSSSLSQSNSVQSPTDSLLGKPLPETTPKIQSTQKKAASLEVENYPFRHWRVILGSVIAGTILLVVIRRAIKSRRDKPGD